MLKDLITRVSTTTENQEKGIFSTLFIAGNKLQTLFDSRIPKLSLKQFMLLSILRQAKAPMTLTQLGNVLGCSRQNVKKIAAVLEKKQFVTFEKSPDDARAIRICPTLQADAYFKDEFVPYMKELKILFEVYSEEEIHTLYHLMMKMYQGIERLENKTKSSIFPKKEETYYENSRHL